MLPPEENIAAKLFPNTGAASNPTPAAPLEASKPTIEQDPKPAEDLAARLFPHTDDGVPEAYKFSVPEDLAHLGLVHDEARYQEFSTLAKSMGLSQSRAQALVEHHLRAAYGGGKGGA